MLGKSLAALILLLIGALPALATDVLQVDSKQKLMAVAHSRERRWAYGDYLCVQRNGAEVACGRVIKTTSKGAIVRFDFKVGDPVEPGEPVEFYARPPKVVQEARAEEAAKIAAQEALEAAIAAGTAPAPVATPAPMLTPTPTPQPVAVPRPPRPKRKEEEWVDLDSLDDEAPGQSSAKVAGPRGPHGARVTKPRFRIMYDWLVTYQPGKTPDLLFDSHHNLLMMEFNPTRELYFGFEVNPNPRYYELDYEISPDLMLRLGRIYIPFDDLTPHSYFGGRVNVARLLPAGGTSFLPDIWTDLGVAVRYRAFYTKQLEVDAHLYVTNGFGEANGTNPVDPAGLYPDFSSAVGLNDNNADKGIGGRLAATLFGNHVGFGASVYRCRYSNNGNPNAGIFMWGVDAQARLGGTQIRGGYVFMTVGTPFQVTESYRRGGAYGEVSQFMGKMDQWRVTLRGGAVQHDSRVVANTDQIMLGGQISYRPGVVAVSLEYDHDLNSFPGKPDNSFMGVRVTVGI